MFFVPMYLGGFWGILLFLFIYILSKKSGRYYLAPLVTFFVSILITVYGWLFVGGFEGMSYGILALGFWVVSILGVIFLYGFILKTDKKVFTKKDKLGLYILPIVFVTSLAIILVLDENYWIIEDGHEAYIERKGAEGQSYYKVFTIAEGAKQVYIVMGEEYTGKNMEVEKVSTWGSTKITVKITDGNSKKSVPFLRIGLDEIKEPLEVITTDGLRIQPIGAQ